MFLYANSCLLTTLPSWHTTHQNSLEIITCFLKSTITFRLKINLKNTEVTYEPLSGSHDIRQDIQIEVQILTQVNKFKYQCPTVTNTNRLDAELGTQMSNAFKAFAWLRKRVWLNKDLSIKIKCAVCRTIVPSTLLYDIESWTMDKAGAQRLQIYMMRHSHKILNV